MGEVTKEYVDYIQEGRATVDIEKGSIGYLSNKSLSQVSNCVESIRSELLNYAGVLGVNPVSTLKPNVEFEPELISREQIRMEMIGYKYSPRLFETTAQVEKQYEWASLVDPV